MILYHGSNIAIDEINLELSKPNKDFGKGFYLSESKEQAQQMAIFKSLILGGDPVVTCFNFDESILQSSSLQVKFFKDYSEEWADFVFANREGISTKSYDIVYGPIANDKVGLQIRKLKDGSIDRKEFLHRLQFMKGITFQYYFGSPQAIQFLKRI